MEAIECNLLACHNALERDSRSRSQTILNGLREAKSEGPISLNVIIGVNKHIDSKEIMLKDSFAERQQK